MKRRDKYLVLKHKDIGKYLAPGQIEALERICELIEYRRKCEGKESKKCVVVYEDLPCYEEVWGLIERDVDKGME